MHIQLYYAYLHWVVCCITVMSRCLLRKGTYPSTNVCITLFLIDGSLRGILVLTRYDLLGKVRYAHNANNLNFNNNTLTVRVIPLVNNKTHTRHIRRVLFHIVIFVCTVCCNTCVHRKGTSNIFIGYAHVVLIRK